jgi:hypothetical protein
VIAVLLAILTIVVAGLPMARLFSPSRRPLELLGLGFLYGTGAVYFVLLALSMAGVRWTLPWTIGGLVLVSGVALASSVARPLRPRLGGGVGSNAAAPLPDAAEAAAPHLAAAAPLPDAAEAAAPHLAAAAPLPDAAEAAAPHSADRLHFAVDAITLLTLVGYVFYATLASLWEWDFWAIWGLKARVFFEHGGIEWSYLENPFNSFAHPDYPLLLPLNFDFAALAAGTWDDRWLGLICVGWAAAITVIVHDLMRDELPPLFASIATLLATSIACSRFVGMAEGPLIAFGGGALLLIRRGLRDEASESIRNGAVLLGLAGCCKNEGLALLAAVCAALVLVSYRRIPRLLSLWPALVVAAPWLLLRATHRLPTDLGTGSVFGRFQSRLTQLPDLARWLGASLPNAWFWVAVVVSWIVLFIFRRRSASALPADRQADRFIVVSTLIQLGFYLASYLVTPNDVQWHISTSWSRLISQIAIPITVVTVVRLSRMTR